MDLLDEELNIYDLELGDPMTVDIPLTFVINDFRNLETRNGTFSKTIKIPSTKVNDSLLSQSFDITAEGFFDRNTKSRFRMERFGVLLMKGYMQLKECIMENGYIKEYELILFSNNSEWFTSLEGLKLRDLNLGTHNFSATNFVASWTNDGDSTDAYVYPFIDFGALTSIANSYSIHVDYFVTGIFIKQILKKIFDEAGYSIESNFFKKQQFRDLILVSPNTFRLTDEQLETRSFIVGFTSDYTYTVYSKTGTATITDTVPYDDETTGEFVDGDANFDLTTHRYNVEFKGKYDLFAKTKITLTITPTPFVSNWGLVGTTVPFVTMKLIKNGTTTLVTQTINVALGDLNNGVYYSGTYTEELQFNLESLDQTLEANDYVIVQITVDRGSNAFAQALNGIPQQTINVKIDAKIEYENTKFYNQPQEKIIEGSDIELADILPDWSQKDFIKYIFSNFNLIAVTDSLTKEITIESRNDFYHDIFDYENWKDKQDVLLEERIVQIEEGLSRELQWKYVVDSNDDNIVKHNKIYKTEFGNKSVILKNEFLTGEKEIASLPYSCSFNGYSFQGSSTPLYMPQLINQDSIQSDLDDGGYGMSLEFEPRIFVYHGLVTPNNPNGYSLFKLSGAALVQLSYPYCYSTKEISTKHDISLAFCNFKDLSTTIQAEDKGLYDRFYADQIRQINFGRLYIAYFKLSETDILNLNFRKPKLLQINGNKTYFHLNKINDYLAGQDESTEVELIQIPFGYGDNTE